MILDSFFQQRPKVSFEVWEIVQRRLESPSMHYLRKMGLQEKKPVPASTIDMFFCVQTQVEERIQISWIPLSSINQNLYTPIDPNLCRHCGITTFIEGVHNVCKRCGNAVLTLVTAPSCNNNTTLGGPVGAGSGKRTTTYMYKRTNHFLDHLKRVQAKEINVVRPHVIMAVHNELKKERIDMGDPKITTSKVRSILKKLKLQKYYVHVFFIASRLSGRAPPTLTSMQEEKLLELFQKIQEPFDKLCPPDRTNMLNYSYILRKLAQILGWYEFMEYFPLLKSRSKIHAQDLLWKKICGEVNFPFYKSIA